MKYSIKKIFKSNALFTIGVIICLLWIVLAILAPVIAPYDPIAQDIRALHTGSAQITSAVTFSAALSTAGGIRFWPDFSP